MHCASKVLGNGIMDSKLDSLSDFLVIALFRPYQIIGSTEAEAGRQLTLQAKVQPNFRICQWQKRVPELQHLLLQTRACFLV